MKISKSILFSLVMLVLVAALYRIIPNRPFGFAPQLAMTLFGGALFVNNKKWAFFLPILSMFISDLLYQFLYNNQLTQIPGFYSGQWINYALFAALTVLGFFVKMQKPVSIAFMSFVSPTIYFIVSNGLVWAMGGGYARPKTIDGFFMCMADGLPFYQGSLMATAVFSTLLFGGYYFIQKQQKTVLA